MPEINTFSNLSDMRDMLEMLRWWRQHRVGDLGIRDTTLPRQDRHVRWAKLSTTSEFTQYPTSGNTLPIVLGFYHYDIGTTTSRTSEFVPYEPAAERIAYFPTGYQIEGSIVRVTLHNGSWFGSDNPGIVHCKTTSSGIPAMSGTTPGQALCELWQMVADGNTSSLEGVVQGNTSPVFVNVYNKASQAVAGDTHIMCASDTNGYLIAIFEDCPSA